MMRAMIEKDALLTQAATHRLHAEKCRVLSESAMSDYGRDALTHCAQAWDRIAEIYERLAAALQDRPMLVLLLTATILAAAMGAADSFVLLIDD